MPANDSKNVNSHANPLLFCMAGHIQSIIVHKNTRFFMPHRVYLSTKNEDQCSIRLVWRWCNISKLWELQAHWYALEDFNVSETAISAFGSSTIHLLSAGVLTQQTLKLSHPLEVSMPRPAQWFWVGNQTKLSWKCVLIWKCKSSNNSWKKKKVRMQQWWTE